MEFRIALLTSLILFFLPFLLMGDDRATGMQGTISIENLKQHVRSIHFDRNPRHHYFELEQAAQYIQREFLKAGDEVIGLSNLSHPSKNSEGLEYMYGDVRYEYDVDK
ncbi:MAG: hypothetical protein MUP27_11155, partial [Desulfobacterales bacterium]|nr:hypothetical protein [Desulfobacterales bacterium]